VLIPIHDKPLTLPLAVASVLGQTVADVEVLLIGDGVTDELRQVAEALVAEHEQVRLLDFEKGPHHGEVHRHHAVEAARSDAIFYLCDDDLMLPTHVADLLELLEGPNLVQCLNGFAHPDGSTSLYAGDLADPACVAAVLDESVRFNFVGISGTAHSREFYRSAGQHWETTPPGWWPDHWQWARMMRHPDFRGATSHRLTLVQLPTSADGRDTWTPEARLAELDQWWQVVRAPGAQDVVDEAVRVGAARDLAWMHPELVRAASRIRLLEPRAAELEAALESVREQVVTAHEEMAAANRQLVAVREELVAALARTSAHNAELVADQERAAAELESLQASVAWLQRKVARQSGG
jgi:Glycosyl transferase family 2